MQCFDEDWHALNLAIDLVEMLHQRVPRERRDDGYARVERAARELADRVDEATHRRTRGAYKVALRRAVACAGVVTACKLPIAVRRHAAASLVMQIALLDDLRAGRRAQRLLH